MKQKVKPIQDKILVKRAEAKDVTKGGLFIPQMAIEQPLYGKIIAVGPGKVDAKGTRTQMSVKPGEHIYFTKNATTEVQHNGSEHLIMKEDRVLLIEH